MPREANSQTGRGQDAFSKGCDDDPAGRRSRSVEAGRLPVLRAEAQDRDRWGLPQHSGCNGPRVWKGMAAEMTDVYEYEIHQEGRSWVVRIPSLGLTTQARNLRETDRMAKSIIALHLERDPTSFEVYRSNIIGLPGTVAQDLQRAIEERGRLAAAQAASVSATTKAATELVEIGVPLRDAGYLLGISHQRVAQLIDVSTETG